jgi:hypothetical protein
VARPTAARCREGALVATKLARKRSCAAFRAQFERIAKHFAAGRVAPARAEYRKIPQAGMGGLTDPVHDEETYYVLIPRLWELLDGTNTRARPKPKPKPAPPRRRRRVSGSR